MTSLDTQCVQGGRVEGADRALVQPLVQSTTYAWKSFDDRPLYSYAREGNETTLALERRLTTLENGGDTVCFTSGLAAIAALFTLLPDGARVVAGRHLYGGTTRLLSQVHCPRLVVETVDSTQSEQIEAALQEPTDLVLVETPSNPTLQITDLRHTIDVARNAGAPVAVDNTFLTPLYQRPLDLGADFSIHSTTKYLDGHNATLGGAIVLPQRHSDEGVDRDGTWSERLRWVRQATGSNLAPFEAWLTLQGIKTLHLRTKRQWESAHAVAQALQAHTAVRRVKYPGLEHHPGHQVHRAQASGDGGIVAFDLGTLDAAAAFVKSLRVFTLAENLGATESLATSPALMTHAALSPARRRADGIRDGLVRLSIGVEDPDDLVADVEQALAKVPLPQEVPV